jgi:hypothetical protein
MLDARVSVNAQRVEKRSFVARADVDAVLHGRDPLLGDVLRLVPGLFAAVGLDGIGIRFFDLVNRVTEGEPLQSSSFVKLRLRLVHPSRLRQKVERPPQSEPKGVDKMVERIVRIEVVLGYRTGCRCKVGPETEPEIRE